MFRKTVRLRIEATPSAPHAARHGVVDGMALEGALADDVALLVSEAVTNSVLHAGLAPGECVLVDAAWKEDCLHVEVRDEGCGLGGPSPATDREGGHGLNIISRLSARWGVHTNGHTHVWFELPRACR